MKITSYILALVLAPWLLFAAEPVTIVLLQDGPAVETQLYQAVKTEVQELLANEFSVRIVSKQADWTPKGVTDALNEALTEADVIVTTGILGSASARSHPELQKPVVVPITFQADLLNQETLPSNFVYISRSNTLAEELETFRQIVPFKKLAVIGDASILSQMTVREMFQSQEKPPVFLPVTNDPDKALKNLGDADAVILLPTWRIDSSSLIKEINQRGLPSFSISGEADVRAGALATTTDGNFIRQLSRRVALNVQQILIQGHARDIDHSLQVRTQLILNMETADQLGISLPWKLIADARLLGQPEDSPAQLIGLQEAMDEAVLSNRDLLVQKHLVESGEQAVRGAKSALLPQVVGSTRGTWIDADRARLAAGASPERSATATVAVRQSLYEEGVRSAYRVEKYLQSAREYSRDSVELDIRLDATNSYLEVLRLEAVHRIFQGNLEVTRANLHRAQDRVEAGEARKSEVYRWESELAQNQRDLLTVQAALDNAEKEFNRVLHRPLDQIIAIEDLLLESEPIAGIVRGLQQKLGDPAQFHQLMTSYIDSALETSTELNELKQSIMAQKRVVKSAKRAFYLPDVALVGEITESYSQGGAGKSFPAGVNNDRFDATVAVEASIPLFTGGARRANRRQAHSDFEQLQTSYEATEERVEQRVIRAMEALRSSYLGIDLAHTSHEAAFNNLRIVTDSYERGVSSVIDLIDAQNNELVTNQRRSNATYSFLMDLMELMRASNQFNFQQEPLR